MIQIIKLVNDETIIGTVETYKMDPSLLIVKNPMRIVSNNILKPIMLQDSFKTIVSQITINKRNILYYYDNYPKHILDLYESMLKEQQFKGGIINE